MTRHQTINLDDNDIMCLKRYGVLSKGHNVTVKYVVGHVCVSQHSVPISVKKESGGLRV